MPVCSFRDSDLLLFQQVCFGLDSRRNLARSVLIIKPADLQWEKADAFQW